MQTLKKNILHSLVIINATLLPTTLKAEDVPTSDEQPLWELGFMGVGTYFPDYPGSDQNHFKPIAFPSVIYRGDVIRAGDKGMLRARLTNSDRYELDISFDGAMPTSSGDNDARQAMEDLDWIGEVGPRLEIKLSETKKNKRSASLSLDLPIRAVFSTNFDDLSPKHRGYTFSPALVYRAKNFADRKLDLQARFETSLATDELMDYFYKVGPEDVTANRPAYEAKGGYLGTRLRLSATQPVTESFSLFSQLRLENYTGATNADSPLHKSDFGYGISFGARYSFLTSDEMVK